MKLKPSYADAHNNLGILLVRSGRVADAIEEFRAVQHYNPESTEIRENLAAALVRRTRSPILNPNEPR